MNAGLNMQAGRRDRRITLERATESRSASNNVVLTWSTLATVWAEKLDDSDGERINAAEVGAEISTRFNILWSSTVSGLNPKDRVRYDGVIYAIIGAKEIGRRQGIQISCLARPD